MANITASSQRSPLQYSRKDYAYIGLSVDQTTNILDTNPIKFNTLLAGNMYLDTANYRVTLRANKTYRMRANVFADFSQDVASCYLQFYDVTNATLVGKKAFETAVSSTGRKTTSNECFYTVTPTVDTIYEVRIAGTVDDLYSFVAAYSYWEITELDTFTPAVYGGQYAYVSPQLDITVALANWTTARAKATFYKTSNGIWYMQFNIKGAMASSSRTSISPVISNVVFYNGSEFQSISADCNAVTAITAAQARTNSGVLDIYHANATTTKYCISGFVELNAKPTGYAIPSDV